MRLGILVVEDHDVLREVTVEFLREQGHEVWGVPDAESMDEVMARWRPDIVVLDVNLPGEDGHSACSRIRTSMADMGIVMLTARASIADRVAGYDRGADVYLAKPTSNEELAAAIQRLGRRVRPHDVQPRLQLTECDRTLTGPAGSVVLSDAELVLLRAMALSPGRQLAHWQLMEALGLEDGVDGKAALEVRLVRLRKKLAQVGASESPIQSVRRMGYRLAEALQILG